MKILLISTFECNGGAAIAAQRVMRVLNKNGAETRMLVCSRQTDDTHVTEVKCGLVKKWNFLRERLTIWFHLRFRRKNLFAMDIANAGVDITRSEVFEKADIIHLHWINQGFLSLDVIDKILHSGKPVVWTMHDMWLFTGICHYACGCERYRESCGNCPLLPGERKNDLSHRVYLKKRFLSSAPLLSVISVSRWLREKATESSLLKSFSISVIPNVIDTAFFAPAGKEEARERLHLPEDKKIILTGAAKLNDPVKGFACLRKALDRLSRPDRYLLVLFGEIKNDAAFLDGLPVEHLYLGRVETEILTDLYNSADVTVVPSLYETFGQTLAESMACATPAVTFGNSGQTDVVDHKINGYMARYRDADDLARGIEWVLWQSDYDRLCHKAREKVERCFSEKVVVRQYLNLYHSMIKKIQ